MIKEYESIPVPYGQNEFRNRFPTRSYHEERSNQRPPQIQSYLKNMFYPKFNAGKRRTHRNLAALFLLGVFSVAVLIMRPYAYRLFSTFAPIKIAPLAVKPEWHQTVESARSPEAINHRYDAYSVSIAIKSSDFLTQGKLHSTLNGFLAQMQAIQFCAENVVNTFHHGKLGETIKLHVKVPELPLLDRYIQGYTTMALYGQDHEWFIQIDDDSYLFIENLKMYLDNFKPTDPIFIHNFAIIRDDAIRLPFLDSNHLPTSIMSKAALDLLTTSDYRRCLLKYTAIPSMGTILIKCLKDFGVKVIAEEALHTTEPTHDFAWPANPCLRPLSFSNLSPKQMEYFFHARPTTGKTSDGITYKWDTLVTYADVFHYTLDDKVTPNIDRHSASNEKHKITASGMDCKKLCEADEDCISWTYEKTKCYTSTKIGLAIERQGTVSGLVMNRYYCQKY